MTGAADLVDEDVVVPAAGALPWRRRRARLQVALVHRPRYDDWSWPKGKVDPGEQLPVTAVREVSEETGLLVRLGRPLPSSDYTVVRRALGPHRKHVRYWAGEVIGGDGVLEHEIDEVAWLDVSDASDRLSYARDREQLRALVRLDHEDSLQTWALALVRHAHSVGRSRWDGHDPDRPLDAAGRARSAELTPILAAYGLTRVLSSPSVRCIDTVTPFAEHAGLRVRTKDGLSEEGHAADPPRAARHLARLLERGEPAALCTHGLVLPDLLRTLAERASDGSPDVRAELAGAADDGMSKGEVLVAHLTGTSEQSIVTCTERHAPR